jgi:coronin-1B/1C/6
VIPLERTGKLPDLFPLVRAHTAPVLDTAWSPFDDDLVASGGEDGRVAITRVDDSVFDMAYASEGHGHHEIRDLEPISGNKMGHGRKAGQVLFHPTAKNVLASASYEVKLWDVESMQCRAEMDKQPDMVQNMDFDYTGSNLATTCKDKKLRLFDTRNGGAPHTVADSHSGVKGGSRRSSTIESPTPDPS